MVSEVYKHNSYKLKHQKMMEDSGKRFLFSLWNNVSVCFYKNKTKNQNNKVKTKNTTRRNSSKYNRETQVKSILRTHIHDHALSWHGTGMSKKSGGVNSFIIFWKY